MFWKSKSGGSNIEQILKTTQLYLLELLPELKLSFDFSSTQFRLLAHGRKIFYIVAHLFFILSKQQFIM